MGILSGNGLQALFGVAFAGVYDDATLERYTTGTVRDPSTGLFPLTKVAPDTAIKVQFDSWNEYQRGQMRLSSEDVRILVLQHNVAVTPDTDDIIVHVTDGSFRVVKNLGAVGKTHWDIQARKVT